MAAWDPVAIYGRIAKLSDAELVRWALENAADSMANHARVARDPASIGNRSKPRPAEAAVYQTVSDRLAALADPTAQQMGQQPA